MTQGVYLIDDFRRFGDSGNADFSSAEYAAAGHLNCFSLV